MAGALASHYLAAHENAGKAAEADALASQARIALKAAAARAEALGSFTQAVTFLEQALTVTADSAEQAALLIQAGNDAFVASQPEKCEALLRHAVELTADGANFDLRARALAEHALSLTGLRRPHDARAELEPVAAISRGQRGDADIRSDDSREHSVGGPRRRAGGICDGRAGP